ncbi:hypothetical protein EDC18_103371 [Natranaerovirga pectinivora]|uniref:YqzL-like protein n=1 Tax=Natranaerovirga pectinivora TaxID=682400 RepID=A0A4R3MR74_9FIRM|nr:hypothetical protein [Natranaerovirga pectinivora]TCT15661.1 hypothetical protein EDC18_103371 [Natranaerovirga pectinivora]
MLVNSFWEIFKNTGNIEAFISYSEFRKNHKTKSEIDNKVEVVYKEERKSV